MKKGLFGKYILAKADGTEIDPKADYFILRLDTDPAARRAAAAYAEHVQYSDRELCYALVEKIRVYDRMAASEEAYARTAYKPLPPAPENLETAEK